MWGETRAPGGRWGILLDMGKLDHRTPLCDSGSMGPNVMEDPLVHIVSLCFHELLDRIMTTAVCELM